MAYRYLDTAVLPEGDPWLCLLPREYQLKPLKIDEY